MKVAALFSGGKDSCFAVWKAAQQGKEIVSLVAFSPENPDSYMFHHPNVQWTKLQAEAIGLPLRIVPTRGEKEKELEDLAKALKQLPIQGVVAGALASQYQKSRVEIICKKLGLELFSPAWGIEPESYWKELFQNNFKVLITKVACEGLGKEWLGREISGESFGELKQLSEKFGFHLAGEGGEFETFVLDGPLFKKKIEIQKSEVEWKGDSGVFLIKEAALV